MTKQMLVPVLFLLNFFIAMSLAEQELTGFERRVYHELVTLPDISVFDYLEFRVDGYDVTLQGEVTRPTLKDEAGNVVAGIEGVESVTNNIEVLPLSPNDDRIRLAVYHAIYGHGTLTRYAIQPVPPVRIIVRNGNVELKGNVATELDKTVAYMQTSSVPGVFSVTNEIVVENDSD